MFNFLRKLFKALNSSAKSWQLSGAIVLAMFTGFLPSNSLFIFDFLFLALVFNVNFGVFLLFSVVFSGIGYLFDPIFESIGYMVLTNEGLNGFFTSLYNSVLFRWSAFNYTLVTGSLLVSFVFALPLMLVLNKLISLYRAKIGEKLNKWKLTRWMKLFNEEATNTSVFRLWGLCVFAGLASIIIVFMILLFDPLAKLAIEKGLSYSLKSQVTLKDFSSSLSELSVSMKGLEVVDKDKLSHNLVQIDSISFDLGFSALVEKKVKIDLLKVQALSFDVKRSSAAKAYTKSENKEVKTSNSSEDSTEAKSKSSNPFSLPSVDDILAKEELKTLTEVKALKADIKKTQDKWTKISSDLKKVDEVSKIKAEAKKLEKSLKGGKI
ncbi:MAG TPA: TIGR03546 family protein, partial [Sulfurimonas sp.]|nr:TIGR03546 family protein [Sulfurimonas sp.]